MLWHITFGFQVQINSVRNTGTNVSGGCRMWKQDNSGLLRDETRFEGEFVAFVCKELLVFIIKIVN
jgi:hypothetical protein